MVPRAHETVTIVSKIVDRTTLMRSDTVSSGDGETDQFEEGPQGSTVVQLTDLRPVQEELDEYSVNQLEPRQELILTAARRSLEVTLLPGTQLRIQCRSSTPHTSSSWIRNGDAISKTTLVIHNVRQEQIGVYHCLRGNQVSRVTVHLRSPVEVQADKAARATFTLSHLRLQKRLQDANKSNSGQPGVSLLLNNIIAPDLAMLDVVPLTYVVTSEWSQCQCAAPEAIQTRSVSCEFLTQAFFITVDGSYCARRKVKAPLARRDCSKTCYSWTVSEWKQVYGFTVYILRLFTTVSVEPITD